MHDTSQFRNRFPRFHNRKYILLLYHEFWLLFPQNARLVLLRSILEQMKTCFIVLFTITISLKCRQIVPSAISYYAIISSRKTDSLIKNTSYITEQRLYWCKADYMVFFDVEVHKAGSLPEVYWQNSGRVTCQSSNYSSSSYSSRFITNTYKLNGQSPWGWSSYANWGPIARYHHRGTLIPAIFPILMNWEFWGSKLSHYLLFYFVRRNLLHDDIFNF